MDGNPAVAGWRHKTQPDSQDRALVGGSDFSSNPVPVFLTLLALVTVRRGNAPRSRAVLFEGWSRMIIDWECKACGRVGIAVCRDPDDKTPGERAYISHQAHNSRRGSTERCEQPSITWKPRPKVKR